MKNKYIKVSHISEDLSTTQIANLTKLNRNIINRYLIKAFHNLKKYPHKEPRK